jgi:hypothetical protein
VISVQTWEEARDLTCLVCGPNPAKKDGIYSQKHHEFCKKKHEFIKKLLLMSAR